MFSRGYSFHIAELNLQISNYKMRLQGEIRLLRVPFFARSSRLSGHRRARPSWFQMHRGGGQRATLGTFETKMAARNGRCSIPSILRQKYGP